jgi:hypothetical protein
VCSLGACAAPPATTALAPEATLPGASAASMATVAQSLVGRRGDEVLAALGPATVIRLDSGHEVWVYRFVEPAPRPPASRDGAPPARATTAPDDPPSELVVLLDPERVVAKFRIRSRAD